MLTNQVSQRQPTTHEMAYHERSTQALIALLIRRSSVRARRGPPVVLAATFALLTGLRPASCLRDLSLNSCRVDGESGMQDPQVTASNPRRPARGLRRSSRP